MAVNIGSIMDKVEAYSKTSAGQQAMKSAITYASSRGGVTRAGGKVRTDADMSAAAQSMIHELKSSASSCGLPDSVMYHFDSLTQSSPIVAPNGAARIEINFGDSLGRPSLVPSVYGHVHNIVALFNNGYNAANKVYGEWHGARIGSLKDRVGLHFMESAVGAFNSGYGAANDVRAVLSDEY